jgi:hypothetical protein
MSRTARLLLLAGVMSATAVIAGSTSAGGSRAPAVFEGAGNGTPVEFLHLPLPEVAEGPFNEPANLNPFEPTFAQLTTGNTVIRSEAQLKRVWRRLFATPYDASLVDFDTHFVILVGAGQIANGSIEVTSVEQFEAVFEQPEWFGSPAVETKLAVTATVTLGGAFPDPKLFPPIYRLDAVAVDRGVEADIIFHRAVIALP